MPKIIFDLEIDLLVLRVTSNDQLMEEIDFQSKSHEKEVLHMFLALLVKHPIFLHLTLKLTF